MLVKNTCIDLKLQEDTMDLIISYNFDQQNTT